VKPITAFLFPVCYFKSECRFSDAIDFRSKVPPLIMEECFAVGEKELKVTYLRSVNRGVVDLGYTAGIECVPHSAGGRIGCTDGNFGAVCPPGGSMPGPPGARRGKLWFFIVSYHLLLQVAFCRDWISQNVWRIQLSSRWLNKPSIL
jgi:hypothetical protein